MVSRSEKSGASGTSPSKFFRALRERECSRVKANHSPDFRKKCTSAGQIN